MSQDLSSAKSSPDFEEIRHDPPSGIEYWTARELMPLLGYARWENFKTAIDRAKESCVTNRQRVQNHFRDFTKNVNAMGRPAEDCYLSRLACYLIAMNGDPTKPEIAAAQAYFVVKTRQQEVQTQEAALEARLEARMRLAKNNRRLSGAAQEAGVTRFGIFQDEGYQGLYTKGLRDIKTQKGVAQSEDLPDRMGPSELAANDFRVTQAEEKLRRNHVQTEAEACRVHHEVGTEVREAILRQGNTPPEDMKAEPSIRPLLERSRRERRKIAAAQQPKEIKD